MSERKLYQHIKTLLASGMVIPQSAEDAFDALDRFVNDVETEVVFDWDTIPGKFKWAAVDANGEAHAFVMKAQQGSSGFWPCEEDPYGYKWAGRFSLPIGFDWRESLQQRPEGA